MAGNAKARKLLKTAASRGESAHEIYNACVDSFDGMDRVARAFCMGYLARLVDKPASANPHDEAAGTKAAQMHERWAAGWREGEQGDFEQLQARALALRGAALN